MYTIPTTRLMTMAGPTQGADGFGLGRGGGTYRLRLERDLGMTVGPFHGDTHGGAVHRLGRASGQAVPVTASDRSVRHGLAATGAVSGSPAWPSAMLLLVLALVLPLALAACGGSGGGGGGAGGAGTGAGGSGSTGAGGTGRPGARTAAALGSAPLL